MSKSIFPCLWFDGKAREAAKFYCKVFDNTSITDENSMVVIFESSGQKFMCLNGGPQLSFNPSISFFILYENKTELNRAWTSLLEGGSVLMALDKYEWSTRYGWLKDRFGVSWQLSYGKMEDVGQKFTPMLMFTENQSGKAEQAIRFYTSVFKNSAIRGILKYSQGDGEIVGTLKHAQFNLGKNIFMATDSSFQHGFTFNEAISFVVNCDTQQEIDYYWNKLTDGGEESQCGWLRDRFGISWQIVPTVLGELMNDPSRSERVINAFLKMQKFEIEKLINA